MHSTTFLLVFFLKGVVVVVPPTCIRLLPPLKTGERGLSESSIGGSPSPNHDGSSIGAYSQKVDQSAGRQWED